MTLLVIGLFIGGVAGFFTAAMLTVASDADDAMDAALAARHAKLEREADEAGA